MRNLTRCYRTGMLLAWVALIGSIGLPQIASAQQNRSTKKPMVREIFVPYTELETLLESQARRVYLTRKEYAELLKEAVKQAPNEPPHAASIVSAVTRFHWATDAQRSPRSWISMS